MSDTKRKWQVTAPRPATNLVRWPAKGDFSEYKYVPMCDIHLQQAVGMGAIIGFMATWEKCEATDCANCESQFRYMTPQERAEAIAEAESRP